MQKTGWLFLLITLAMHPAGAQVTGGRFAMSFLQLSNSPHVSALGGIAMAHPGDDISFALQNPALMRPSLHNQLGLNFNNYYAGIKVLHLNYGYHVEKIATSFSLKVTYLNYGDFEQTDFVGNQYGTFRASDYAVTLGASRSYKTHWRYGAALSWAHSSLYDKKASAVLMNVGVTYTDTSSLLTVGLVAKNMGFMAKRYDPSSPAEPLPFDLQLGVSKRFAHLPLMLMATAHHLYEWDIRYDNPADARPSGLLGGTDTTAPAKSYFADKLFRHFNFAAELTLARRLSLIVGYSHLRRSELSIKDHPGLAGFSFGASLYLNKFQVHYARSYYHLAGAYNEIGLNFAMNKLFHVGSLGEKIGWSADYPGPF